MRVSLVTTTFNAAETIADCVASANSQSYEDVEHIIIDAASTDSTVKILEANRREFQKFLSEPDGGTYFGLNKGLKMATGEVIGFLHSDDILSHSEVIEKIAAAFSSKDVSAVYGDLKYISRNDPRNTVRLWKSGEFAIEKLKFGWMPPHPALFFRRSVYEKFGTFNTTFRIAADYEFMLRVLPHLEGRLVYLPEVIVKMRTGGVSNRSLKNMAQKSYEDYRAIRANKVGGIFTLICKNLSKIPQFFKNA